MNLPSVWHVSGILNKPFPEPFRLPYRLGGDLQTPYGLDILCYYQINMVSLPFRITSNSVSSGISLKALRGF